MTRTDLPPRHRDTEKNLIEGETRDAVSFDLVIELDDDDTQGEVAADCGCRLERTEFSVGLLFCDFHRRAPDLRDEFLDEVSRDWWTEEQRLGTLRLSPEQSHEIIFLWHISPERYERARRAIGMDGVDLQPAGIRQYVQVHVAHEQAVTNGERERLFLATIRSWYYPQEQTLMIQEVDLFPPYRQADPQTDPTLAWLWKSFEGEMRARYPACQRIVTPEREPQSPGRRYQAFLTGQGFVPHKEHTFLKMVSRVSDE